MRNKTMDAFRGLIMIIMALDHASYFVINTHFYEGYNKMEIPLTTLAFFTRWITHLCAPGFFFLMGYGAYYSFKKRQYKLLYRSLLLIILQFTLINFAWQNDIIYVGVITALALSLAILTITMPLMKQYGLVLGILVIVVSQVVILSNLPVYDTLLIRLFFVPGPYKEAYILYTVFPWLGLAMIGAYYADRPIPYLRLSIVSSVIFLMFTTSYDSVYQILTLVKYPASIRFLSLTMSINFLIIYSLKGKDHKILGVYGQAPLVFYILHLYLYAGMGLFLKSNHYGLLYVSWLIGILALYYPCYYSRKRVK